MSTGRFRLVLVPVGPRDEEAAGPQGQECFDRFELGLGVVEEVRRREAQGPLGLRSEDIGAPASARAISGGLGDRHAAREMVHGVGDLARYALHEDVIGPAVGVSRNWTTL